MLSAPLLALAVLVPAAQDWSLVRLEPGVDLDLSTGRLGAEGDGSLAIQAGRLTADADLASLEQVLPWRSVEREEPLETSGALALRPGSQARFSLADGTWGVLRVVEAHPETPLLEWARAGAGADQLTRDPLWVRVEGLPGEHRLLWEAAEGQTYRVSSRPLGSAAEPVVLAEVPLGEWREPAPAGDVVEYFVERTGGGAPGTRVLGLRQDVPGETPVPLTPGLRLDLLSGQRGGERAHLEVTQISQQTAFVLLHEDVVMARATKRMAVPTWTPQLPAPDEPPRGRAQTGLTSGSEVVVRTREGVHVRLIVDADDDGLPVLTRQVDLSGVGLFPRAPEDPVWSATAPGVLRLEFTPLPYGIPSPETVSLVLEQELEPGVWGELAATAPGARELVDVQPIGVEELPVARLRARHVVEHGPHSLAGSPFLVLPLDAEDPSALTAAARLGLAGLGHEDFRHRLRSRELLEALGADALPVLSEAVVGDDVGVEARAAVRDLLLTGRFGDEGQRLALAVLAREVGIESEVPPELAAPEAAVRALALLRHGQEEAFEPWVSILREVDQDPAVAALAGHLLQRESTWATPTNGDLAVLSPVAGEESRPPLDWRAMVLDGSPADLALRLRRAADPRDRERAFGLLALAQLLDASGPEEELATLEAVELVLRLIALDERLPARTLREVLGALGGDEGANMRAARELADARRAGPSLAAGAREVLRVEPGQAGVLREALTQRRPGDPRPLDLVLAPGTHDLEGEGPIAVPGGDLRLLGEEGAILKASLRFTGARNVVLQGIDMVSESGICLWATGTELTVLDCRLRSRQKALQLDRSHVELFDTELAHTTQTVASGVVWVGVGSRLEATGCLVRGDSIYLDEGSQAHLDRCAVLCGARPLFQGRANSSRATLWDSVVWASAGCMQGSGALVLEGVVLDGASLASLSVAVRACPESVHLVGTATDLGGAERRCSLGR